MSAENIKNKQDQNNITFSKRQIDTIFSPQIEIFMPFAGTVDASRTNMSAKQSTQVVISKNTEMPLIINKKFKKLTTINSPFMEAAEDDGFIIYNQGNLLILYYKNLKKLVSKYIPPLKKLVNTSLSLKYKINKSTFKKDEIIFDYTNLDIEAKIPKIGYRAKTLYMQFFGYSSDDAVIISESFAKKAENDYFEKVYIPITKTWKYYRLKRNEEKEIESYLPILGKIESEDLIRYNKIDIENHFISETTNVNNDSSIFFSKNIDGFKEGEIIGIKVHFFDKEINEDNYKDKINELDKKYIYNRGLIKELEPYIENQFKEKIKLFKSFKALGLPEDQAKEIADNTFEQYLMMNKLPKHYKQFIREKFNLEDKFVDGFIEVDMKITKKTTRGDKFTNLFAGKATAALIIPDHLMPKNEDGETYDLIFNTLGIPGRNNWGVIFESAISKVIQDVEKTASLIQSLNYEKEAKKILKNKINFINEKFIKEFDKEYYNQIRDLLSNYNKKMENGKYIYEMLVEDILEKGFYLFVPNFLKLPYNKFFYDFIKPYFIKFDGDDKKLRKREITISGEFMEWLREAFDFKEPFTDINESKVLAQDGMNYMLKLHHTSFSKHNSVSFTTSYSKITGQPVRGRKKGGGQHISWQSLSALLAHKENNAVLKEFYTIKSDAIDEKENFLMKYIRDGEYYLKNRYNSVTKKTLNNALKIFGMKFEDDE